MLFRSTTATFALLLTESPMDPVGSTTTLEEVLFPVVRVKLVVPFAVWTVVTCNVDIIYCLFSFYRYLSNFIIYIKPMEPNDFWLIIRLDPQSIFQV